METTTQTSLYERLGGKEGISKLVDDIVDRHMENPAIATRFLPYRERPEELAVIKEHLCEFFGMGSGGPETYTGKEMPEAHRGMNISEEEYMHATDDIMLILDRHGMDENTKGEVLAIVWSLKEQIMHQ